MDRSSPPPTEVSARLLLPRFGRLCLTRDTIRAYVGVITFPSFHATMATLYALACRNVPGAAVIASGLNLCMLASIPYPGGHYFHRRSGRGGNCGGGILGGGLLVPSVRESVLGFFGRMRSLTNPN